MKKILGLDLGTASIGWALVNEAQNEKKDSSIIKTGVRIIQYDTFNKVDKLGNVSESKNPTEDFTSGKGLSPNAKRTKQRGARRTLDRYQDRRDRLIALLKRSRILEESTVLTEVGKHSTHSLWQLRAQAAAEEIALSDFARVLLAINKKRGYKSNRKTIDEGDGQVIDGMDVAKKLYEEQITPGQYALGLLNQGRKQIPHFYRSDLEAEFDQVWKCQKEHYPARLTEDLREELKGKKKEHTRKICEAHFGIEGRKRTTKGRDQKIENYRWREMGLTEKIDLEQLTIVLQEINKETSDSSGYLGAMSDRSKQLIIKDQTIGQYLYSQLKQNPHTPLKNQVFYRQDYLDEFERIWEIQSEHRKTILTDELKSEIRDLIIFYQRRLKSQKGLISICEFEGKEHEIIVDGEKKIRVIGPRVIPKSSPLFQEFKIWQILNNLKFRNNVENQEVKIVDFDEDLSIRNRLFDELNIRGKLTDKKALNHIFSNPKDWELNFETVEGNRTNEALYKAYQKIVETSGHEVDDKDLKRGISQVFDMLGIKKEILDFDADLSGQELEKQPAYQLWHLLYSYQGDSSSKGNQGLLEKLKTAFGFDQEYAQHLVNVTFQDEYGSLSTRAIRKILPFLREGREFSDACRQAGYNHSNSLEKEENEKRELASHLKMIPKNSLRNPVVEKILNQMVNVVNAVIDQYGRPDEIRIELARDLKKSSKEREEMTKDIADFTKRHETIRKKINELPPFNSGVRITRNDILKYKLYEELESNGYKTLYTNTPVPLRKLFTMEFDIEHIIPQATLFDDSFSNKTLAARKINLDKGSKTAYDFLQEKYGEDSDKFRAYLARIEKLLKDGKIKKAKYRKLLMKGDEIPDDFVERDLRNTQYIAKKALQMLHTIVRTVTPTTGSITNKLREDWQLINVMQELNWEKFEKQGLTTTETNKHGEPIKKIANWSKRNDHRHHAMDAIAVAFTKPSHVQYFNYLNARKNERHEKHKYIDGIEKKETYRNDKNKLLINPPIALVQFRAEAKRHLEGTLISFKARNKVFSRNKNRAKGLDIPQITYTPRGQLHEETIYGQSAFVVSKEEKPGPKFDEEKIKSVAKKEHREALLNRLAEFGDDPKMAFAGKNSPTKNPIYLDGNQSKKLPEKVKLMEFQNQFTIRKPISSELKIDKVVDLGVKRILQTRLDKYGGDAKKAFVNLEENPIWLDKENGISIKRVTITGASTAKSVHQKKDHHGNEILNETGEPMPTNYVKYGNNHHVAIYQNAQGKLQDDIRSFFEVVARKNEGLPVIDKRHNADLDWEFLFTMKRNEYFIFPNKEMGFDPNEIDLTDESNYAKISPNLFRVQKLSKVTYGNSSVREYVFRHHLETTVEENKALKNIAFRNIKSLQHLVGIVKVRINHIGQIVKVGEY